MYISKNMEMSEGDAIKKFISDYGFGVLVADDLTATHLPLIYESDDGTLGCLYGHFGRTNSHCQVAENRRVMIKITTGCSRF